MENSLDSAESISVLPDIEITVYVMVMSMYSLVHVLIMIRGVERKLVRRG